MKKLKQALRILRAFGGTTGTIARAILQVLQGNSGNAMILLEASGDRLLHTAQSLWLDD